MQITPSWFTHSMPSHTFMSVVTFSIGTRPQSVSTSCPSAMQASSAILPFCRKCPLTPCYTTGTLNMAEAELQ